MIVQSQAQNAILKIESMKNCFDESGGALFDLVEVFSGYFGALYFLRSGMIEIVGGLCL